MTDFSNLKETMVDDILVKHSDCFPREELNEYVQRGKKKYGTALEGLTVCRVVEDEDMVDIFYDVRKMPFQRLRRITGYLVGTLDRWNDAKRSEEKDRVKHDVG